MELDSQTLSSFVLGVVVGLLLFLALYLMARRQLRLNSRQQIEQYEQTILDLRQERAEGRETNRRLRHELAISTPEHLESTRLELADARERVLDLESKLAEADVQLSLRDRSLRAARLAIQEIRLQLEQGRFGDASAQSAEYLDHGLDPGDEPMSGRGSLPPALGSILDDGVAAIGVDTTEALTGELGVADHGSPASSSPESSAPEPSGPEPSGPEPSGSGPSGSEPSGPEPVGDGPEIISGESDGESSDVEGEEILVGDAGPGEPVV